MRNITGVIMPYLLTLANRNDPISVAMPKVAKASTIVAVTCHWRWHYRLKYNAYVNYPKTILAKINSALLTNVRLSLSRLVSECLKKD